MKNFLILFLASFCIYSSIAADRVVIVGGGPVGLATAIEAITSGHEVTLIEKRDSYTRKQTIILDEDSLKLLQHWNVSLATCRIIPIAEDKQIGMVVIQDLEMALKERASLLGLHYILGQYTMLRDNTIVVESNQITKEIAYDILVGADGVKSKVREDACLEKYPIDLSRLCGLKA